MANLAGKNEAVLALKSPADKLYKKLRSETHHLPSVAPDKVHAIDVHEGDWESHGSVKLWTYTCEGKKETLKERIEIDDATKTLTFVVVEGHMMEELKSYKILVQFVPKPEDTTIGKIKIEYEKLNPNVRVPTRYLEFAKALILDIDAQLLKNE